MERRCNRYKINPLILSRYARYIFITSHSCLHFVQELLYLDAYLKDVSGRESDYNDGANFKGKIMDILFYYRAGILRSGTTTIELSRQNKLGLKHFCENAGVLVTKEEFIQVCWESKGVIVSDNTVRQTLFRMRSALSEIGAPEDTLITQGRNGYILKPGVISLTDSDNIYEEIVKGGPASPVISEHSPVSVELAPNFPEKRKWIREKIKFVLAGTAVLIMFTAGLFLRLAFFTHNLSFTHYKDEGGRAFFFSENIRKDKSKENAIRRAVYWMNRNNLSASDRPYVYVSADWRDTLTFFSCQKEITDATGECLTINVIGDNKK